MAYNLPNESTRALGMHGAGVPYQKSTHNNATVEVITWSLLLERDTQRLMFTALHNDFYFDCACGGLRTWFALLEGSTCESLNLLKGCHDVIIHDGHPWYSKANAHKVMVAGKTLGLHELILQNKGDWERRIKILICPKLSDNIVFWEV